jgi:U3 small nucleolar RNA-associated protein 7
MFTPNTTEPVVKMLCHKTNINAVAVQNNGNYLYTLGNDRAFKVWDLRTYQ